MISEELGLELRVLDESDPAVLPERVGRMTPSTAREVLAGLAAEQAMLTRQRRYAETQTSVVLAAPDSETVGMPRQWVLDWALTADKQRIAIDDLEPWRLLVAGALREYVARKRAR
ncbi:hypothetical protein [Amycolatopsis sp. NPDC004079]|uniref:hypothetical protein n=1 Tax=Amycolatopsis sp. NPDC004079 TaxID=3154549 RepID=UPI0033B5707D